MDRIAGRVARRRAQDAAHARTPRAYHVPVPMPERAPRILLVDDEQSIQTLLSYPLRKEGYEVVQASDGREALERFGQAAFDLVVPDGM